MRILVCGDRHWSRNAIDYADDVPNDTINMTDLIAADNEQKATMFMELHRIAAEAHEDEALVLIHGAAKGADTLSGEIVSDIFMWRGWEIKRFPADWKKYGKAAGPIRNQQMLEEGKPDLVLAFHDDIEHSKGTKDMITRAKKANIPVRIITSHV